jgi:hypothetical protein
LGPVVGTAVELLVADDVVGGVLLVDCVVGAGVWDLDGESALPPEQAAANRTISAIRASSR